MPKFFDISLKLGENHTDYPGDPVYRRVAAATLAADGCAMSELRLSAHSGTHLDAPAHFIAGGKTIDAYPLSRFQLDARVVEVPADADEILPEHLPANLPEDCAVLFKTANSGTSRVAAGRYDPAYIGLSEVAAERLTSHKVSLVGIDYLSIDPKRAEGHPAHHTLLAADILILESCDLRAVPAGAYRLFCAPLALSGAEASPVRAYLQTID